jgi:hypothetical protein
LKRFFVESPILTGTSLCADDLWGNKGGANETEGYFQPFVAPDLCLISHCKQAGQRFPNLITLFRFADIPEKTACYHSPRKYLSTQPEALMLENVIIR